MSAQATMPFVPREFERAELPPPVIPAVPSHAAALIAQQVAADERADSREIYTQMRVNASLAAKFAADRVPAAPRVAPLPSAEISELRWYEDQGFYGSPVAESEISDQDRRFAFSAEGEYLAACREKTGESIDPEMVETFRAAARELLAQSHEIASRMETAADRKAVRATLDDVFNLALSAGANGRDAVREFEPIAKATCERFKAYRDTPFGLYRYFVHSGHVEKIPAFRRIMFIPYVAQHARGPMLSALEAFLAKHLFARFWTFTSGIRVRLSGVRDRAEWLHRRLSELNAQDFMKAAGIRIVFRSTELGTPEMNEQGHVIGDSGEIERDETGQLYFHVHAHCAVILTKGALPGKKWDRLLKRVHSFWGFQWDDGGAIRDARECCKYVTKPGEMLKLTGEELVELQEQLSRLKMVQPMDALAEEIKRRADPANPLTLVKRRTPDGPIYREVKNWNRHNRKTDTEKHWEAAARMERREARGSMRVVARQLPGFGPCGIAEPRVVVMATEWSEKEVRRDESVQRLIRATAGEFWAASAIRVHTCTPTVGESRAFEFVSKLDPPKQPLTGAEIAGYSR